MEIGFSWVRPLCFSALQLYTLTTLPTVTPHISPQSLPLNYTHHPSSLLVCMSYLFENFFLENTIGVATSLHTLFLSSTLHFHSSPSPLTSSHLPSPRRRMNVPLGQCGASVYLRDEHMQPSLLTSMNGHQVATPLISTSMICTKYLILRQTCENTVIIEACYDGILSSMCTLPA